MENHHEACNLPAHMVFHIPELCEHILLDVEPLQLLHLQPVCRALKDTITSSIILRKKLFMLPPTHKEDSRRLVVNSILFRHSFKKPNPCFQTEIYRTDFSPGCGLPDLMLQIRTCRRTEVVVRVSMLVRRPCDLSKLHADGQSWMKIYAFLTPQGSNLTIARDSDTPNERWYRIQGYRRLMSFSLDGLGLQPTVCGAVTLSEIFKGQIESAD